MFAMEKFKGAKAKDCDAGGMSAVGRVNTHASFYSLEDLFLQMCFVLSLGVDLHFRYSHKSLPSLL